MKKLRTSLFLLLTCMALVISMSASAQRGSQMPLVAGDTIVNTATVTKIIPVLTAGYAGVALQANITLISGTGAGTAQLMGSVDGTNYYNIGSATTITNVASQYLPFSITAPVPVYVKLLFTGAGTESAQVRIWYVTRKYTNP